jgi:hypothetical protein
MALFGNEAQSFQADRAVSLAARHTKEPAHRGPA